MNVHVQIVTVLIGQVLAQGMRNVYWQIVMEKQVSVPRQPNIDVRLAIMVVRPMVHQVAVSVRRIVMLTRIAAQEVPSRHCVLYRLQCSGIFLIQQVLERQDLKRIVIIAIKNPAGWRGFFIVYVAVI